MKILNSFRIGLFGGLGVLVAIAIGQGLVTLATILTYVGAALFLALGVDPAVSFLEKRKVPRALAIVLVLLLILGVFAGFIFAIVPVIADQVSNLINQVPEIVSGIGEEQSVRAWFEGSFPALDYDKVRQGIEDFFTSNLQTITSGVLNTVLAVASGLFGALIVLILMLYFVASLSGIKRGLYQLVPASKREKFIDISEQISDSVGRYVVGQISLGATNGVLTFLFLTVLGWVLNDPIEYTALLAFVAFLFSLVPLVGTISGSVIITAFVFFFDEWPAVLVVGIWYLVYMQVEAYLLSPRIMNRAVKVPGVVVVIAALAGGTLLGLLGALVAIPVAASILLIVKQVIIPRQNEL